MIRKVSVEDREWVLDVAENAYTGTRFGFNRRDAGCSFDAVLERKNILFLRGEKTFFYGFIDPFMCNYATKDAQMELLVGEGNAGVEPLKLIHVAMEWARQGGAQVLQITSTTEHEFGERIMSSLKATKRVVYDIPLTGGLNA
jgi:hypothetical protein